jgi:DNA-binding transcriptional LysR family regulator
LTIQDLRAHRQLLVRESGSKRATRPSIDAAQRWTVSHMPTSIEAARTGCGYAWFPEEKIRYELSAGTLKKLPLREGGERFLELYLVFADRDAAGPGTLRLAEIIRELVASECVRSVAATVPAATGAKSAADGSRGRRRAPAAGAPIVHARTGAARRGGKR